MNENEPVVMQEGSGVRAPGFKIPAPPELELRKSFDLGHITALNELVHAVERVTVPEPIEIPDWATTPESIECIGEEQRTPEELIELGLKWQVLAGKLHDLLHEIAGPSAIGDLANVIEGLHVRAADAREALVTLGGYQAALPARPGL